MKANERKCIKGKLLHKKSLNENAKIMRFMQQGFSRQFCNSKSGWTSPILNECRVMPQLVKLVKPKAMDIEDW